MKNLISMLFWIAMIGLLLSSCAAIPLAGAGGQVTPMLTSTENAVNPPKSLVQEQVTPTGKPALEKPTPFASEPAAGACASFTGPVVSISIQPDVPSPRCTKVTGEQRLRVINETGQVQNVKLGAFEAQLDPGKDATSEATFGELLEPGDNLLLISGLSGGAEIFLVQD